MKLNTLVEIEVTFEMVTDADVRRAELHLGAIANGETKLGTVEDPEPRRMWATAEKFQKIESETLLKLKFEIESQDDQARLAADAARCHAMEEIARDLFWVMAKDSVGQDAWVANGAGLRAVWTLVTGGAQAEPRSFMQALFGFLPKG